MDIARLPVSEQMTFIATRVGQALHAWSRVELELSSLFRVVTEMPSPEIAHVAFASIISFEARLKVCDQIMPLVAMTDAHRAVWRWVHNRLNKKSKKRAELAHFTIVIWGEGETERVRLVPYYSEGNRIIDTSEGLSATQIEERADTFNVLQADLAWLRADIQVLKGTLPTNPLPISDRLRSAILNVASPNPTGIAPPPPP